MHLHDNGMPDFVVRGKTLAKFQRMDLGNLANLPSRAEDLVALSLRMDAAFRSIWTALFERLAREHDSIPTELSKSVLTEFTLNFIERYGVLALLSTGVLHVLWESQRPMSKLGPKRLRLVGERLATFALAAKGWEYQKTIDLVFKLFKPSFLDELERLSRELGESASTDAWANILLTEVRNGDYPMLQLNFTLLEQFLRSEDINKYLRARNSTVADKLAEYGIAKVLKHRAKHSITPDRFFYAWIGWITNKAPKTVRRQIQTAESQFRKKWVTKIR